MTARYDSFLMISLQPSELVGAYTCSVDNLVSAPSEQTLVIQGQLDGINVHNGFNFNAQTGIWFVGDTNVSVGENATISCFSDLNVQRVEWLLNGDVIIRSSSLQADLTFSPVQEYLHNREYTCRAITAYGTLERSITIVVQSKCHDNSKAM